MNQAWADKKNVAAKREFMDSMRRFLLFIDNEREIILRKWEADKRQYGEDAWAGREDWRIPDCEEELELSRKEDGEDSEHYRALVEYAIHLEHEVRANNLLWERGRDPQYERLHDLIIKIINETITNEELSDYEARMVGLATALSLYDYDRALFEDGEWDEAPSDVVDGESLRDRLERIYGCRDLDRVDLGVPPRYEGFVDETFTLPRGNYVITDPCYLRAGEDDYDDLTDMLGDTFHMRDTLYGDWGCTLFKVDGQGHKEPAGQFCADAGLVCVADWDAAVAHNPEVASWSKECPWTMTIIQDFEGTATFQVTENWHLWQRRKPNHVEYELGHDYELRVILEGTHGTGEAVRYESRQTSL